MSSREITTDAGSGGIPVRRDGEGGEEDDGKTTTTTAPVTPHESDRDHIQGGGGDEESAVVRVAVPEGDLESALRAVEKAFLLSHNPSGGGILGIDHIVGDKAVIVDDEVRRALSETCESVRHQIRSLARGIPGDEYDALFARSGGGLGDGDGGDSSDDCSSDVSSDDESGEEDEDDENIDPDEEEANFLDHEAVARVRSLRMQVRAAGERLNKLRTEAPRRAGRLVAEEIDTMARFMSSSSGGCGGDGNVEDAGEDAEDEGDDASSTPSQRESQLPLRVLTDVSSDGENGSKVDDISPTNRNAMKNMQDSLDRLNELLERVNGELPDKLESYQNTNEVVDAYIRKRTKGRNEQGEYEPSNRVERAMLSGEDDGERKNPREETTTKEQFSPKSRFVNFLGGGSRAT